MRIALVNRPIDVSALLSEVASPSHGATSLFVGSVRDTNDGRAVTGIDYEAYTAMAERELNTIVREAALQFDAPRIAIEHRLGTLDVGDVSIAIAVSHERRAHALDAARFLIEEIKRRVPIWKREHYVDGTFEWVDPTRTAAERAERTAS